MTLDEALENLYSRMDTLMTAWQSMGNEHNKGRVTGMKIAKGMIEKAMSEVDKND